MATDFELQVLAELSEIKSTGAATAAKVEALDTRLFNGGTGVIHELQKDIQEIKDERADEAKWTRIHNVLHYGISPFLILGHSVLRYFGINI